MAEQRQQSPLLAYAKNGFDYDWLVPHCLYDALRREPAGRRQAYRQWFRSSMTEADLKAIRDSAHKGWALRDELLRAETRC